MTEILERRGFASLFRSNIGIAGPQSTVDFQLRFGPGRYTERWSITQMSSIGKWTVFNDGNVNLPTDGALPSLRVWKGSAGAQLIDKYGPPVTVDAPAQGTTVKDAQRGNKHEVFSASGITLLSGEFITVQYTIVFVGIISGTNWFEGWDFTFALLGDINYAI